jgi:hypothetical protein
MCQKLKKQNIVAYAPIFKWCPKSIEKIKNLTYATIFKTPKKLKIKNGPMPQFSKCAQKLKKLKNCGLCPIFKL